MYTYRVFLNSEPSFPSPEKVRSFISRNRTPPYVSGVPDVRHVALRSLNVDRAFLIMCTDGLMDSYEDDRLKLEHVLAPRWVEHIGDKINRDAQRRNLALSLLRDALGGEDGDKVSRMITVEMAFRWMDDTTVLVHHLC